MTKEDWRRLRGEVARPPLKQKLPEEITNQLLATIRSQFCPDMPDEIWFRDNMHFIRVRVIFWPATFLVKKGFTIPPNRYLAIMQEIIKGIQRHGQTDKITYWPRYLAVCVQRHFQTNWETYYKEAKSALVQIDAAVLALKAIPRAEGPDAVAVMAATHRLLTAPKRRKETPPQSQGEFLL